MKVLDSEQALIQKCLLGEQQAQFQLYTKHAKSMLNVAYRIVNNREDAKDVLQDAFIKAFSNLENFNAKANFTFWLKRIIINTAINHLKKRGGLKSLHKDYSQQQDIFKEVTPTNKQQLQLSQVQNALMQLPDGYRTVLCLYLIEGYDHREIASILNIAVSTSLTQYKRGKDKLIQIIKSQPNYG